MATMKQGSPCRVLAQSARNGNPSTCHTFIKGADKVGRAWWAVETWVKRRKSAIGIVWSFPIGPTNHQILHLLGVGKPFQLRSFNCRSEGLGVLGCLGDRHGSIMMNLSKQTKTNILSCSSSESFFRKGWTNNQVKWYGLSPVEPIGCVTFSFIDWTARGRAAFERATCWKHRDRVIRLFKSFYCWCRAFCSAWPHRLELDLCRAFSCVLIVLTRRQKVNFDS